MKKLILAVSAVVLLSGCAREIKQNDIGYNIMVTSYDSNVSTNCERIGMIQINLEGASVQYWNGNELQKQMETQAREQTSIKYPEADTVAMMNKDTGPHDIDWQAIALKCFK